MSTDYYWRWAHCDCCKRYTSTHMFSSGLLFRAYIREDSPFPGGGVNSVEEWKDVTATVPGRLVDEYGKEHGIGQFWEDVYTPSFERINWGEQAGMNAWQDNQGFWFTYHDFGGPHA